MPDILVERQTLQFNLLSFGRTFFLPKQKPYSFVFVEKLKFSFFSFFFFTFDELNWLRNTQPNTILKRVDFQLFSFFWNWVHTLSALPFALSQLLRNCLLTFLLATIDRITFLFFLETLAIEVNIRIKMFAYRLTHEHTNTKNNKDDDDDGDDDGIEFINYNLISQHLATTAHGRWAENDHLYSQQKTDTFIRCYYYNMCGANPFSLLLNYINGFSFVSFGSVRFVSFIFPFSLLFFGVPWQFSRIWYTHN